MTTASQTQSDLTAYLKSSRAAIDQALDTWLLPSQTPPGRIHEAMRYSVFAGGKRLRPILALAAADACGGDSGNILKQAAALELIHTYSLIHDDLPAMDDDDLRRGKPTSHIVFGEAMAILAGDALLTEAFHWLAAPSSIDPARQIRAVRLVARAIDSKGMIGGQVADIDAENLIDADPPREELARRLEEIHRNKTGQLLTASVLLGGILSGAEEAMLRLLEEYGRAAGLLFQVVDDILDEEETAEVLGKTAGKDKRQRKLTFPALHGMNEARKMADVLHAEAVRAAAQLPGSRNYLPAIADYIRSRRT